MSLEFDDQPLPGATLMARDAARLAALEADPAAGPSLLWYRWERPTISLGRLQDPGRELDLAACERDGLAVVTRPTGGRAVLHAEEWTYGAVVPLDHPVLGGGLAASCRALVGVVGEALREAYGIECAPAGGRTTPAARAPAAACFATAFGHELVVGGRKLMGSAQRRTARALLQQGSLLVGPGHARLARYLRRDATGQAGPADEAALAASTVTLGEHLGAAPDPGAFRAALARAWSRAVGEARAKARRGGP